MAGFAAAIGGAGNALNEYGQQVRAQNYQAHQNDLNRWMLQHEQLSQALERASRTYAGPEGERLRDLQLQVSAAPPLSDLTPFYSKYAQHTQNAQKVVEARAAQQASALPAPAPPPQAGAPGTVTANPNVGTAAQPIGGLTSQIAAVPPAAQVSSNPVQPSAQGGGSSSPAAFPKSEPVPTTAVPPVAAPQAMSAGPLPSVGDFLNRSLQAFQNTGYIDPVIEQFLPEQTKIALAQQKLGLLEPNLKKMEANGQGDLANFIRMNVISGGSGIMPGLIGALEPRRETNVVAGNLSPDQLEQLGLPKDIDPNTPLAIEVNKMNPSQIIAARVLGVPLQTRQTEGGGLTTFNPRTGAVGGGTLPNLVAPGMTTPINTGVDPTTGQSVWRSKGDVLQDLRSGHPLGVIPQSEMGRNTSVSSYTDPFGRHTQQTITKRTLPGIPGAPATAGTTPVPAAPGRPTTPTTGLPVSTPVRPLDPSNELDAKALGMAKDAAAEAHLITNSADKARVASRMAELGLSPGMITSSMRDRAKNARLILDHLKDIQGIIEQADKDGDLGVVASRWNDFLTNKLGSDPTKTQVFARLSSELGFLSTAVSMAHGGLRGGSSPTMVEHWEKALDAKDARTLRAKLGEATKWMQGYAQLDNGLGQGGTSGTVTGVTGNKPDVNDLRKKYNY